jgi:isopenicillin N synthase-like dioxygenase
VIPVIDLGTTDRRATAQEIGAACRDTGFFYVKNHGVPVALIEAQFEWARRFFALPLAEKLEIDLRKSPCNRGYEAMGGQTLDAEAPPDLKEGFYMGWHREPDHPYVRAGLANHGPNVWPRSLPGFAGQMQKYYDAMFLLGRQLSRLVALSLELEERFFERHYEEPMAILRLLHYPPHPKHAAPKQLGAGAHTDWGLITLLAQDDLGGLEVRNAAGHWMLAQPIRGTFVVNIGDMLERWTNGVYHSTMHRVLNRSSERDRYSVPFFFEPDYHTRIECLPMCRSASNPPRYAPCTAGEHIAQMYRKTYGAAA